MDIEALEDVRGERWRRLEYLSKQRRLTGAQSDELARLYASTSSDLSAVRSSAPEPTVVARLSVTLATARIWLTGSHTLSAGSLRRFLTRDLPASLFRVRWWGVSVTVAVVVLAALSTWWLLAHPENLAAVGPPETRARIAEFEFENYYVEYSSASFAAQVWTNNGLLAFQSIAAGITGIFPLILMYNTVGQLSVAAAIMAEHDMLDIFFQLIAPHGLLELSAVFVAVGAGLKIFWTMLVPGRRSRSAALAQEARIAMGAGIGLAMALFASALVEGYITGSTMPWSIKVALGIVVWMAFWAYIFVVGRKAHEAGVTGDLADDFATATVAVT